jgi:transposase
MTTLLPANVKVHLALGFIDMRKGIDGLSMLVQSVLHQDPFTGHLFVFRGRTRAKLIKIIFWDGTGFCLFTKRLEHGMFLWPPNVKPDETLSLHLGAAVTTDRRRGLADSGTTMAADNRRLVLRPIDSIGQAVRRERCESAPAGFPESNESRGGDIRRGSGPRPFAGPAVKIKPDR